MYLRKLGNLILRGLVIIKMFAVRRLTRVMSNVSRERKARIELDPFDNPYLDIESAKPGIDEPGQPEPWPRRKLKELYILALELFKDIPDDDNYRKLMEEMTRYRLKVVENNTDVYAIETAINFGPVEHLIEAA
jgi:hypothetical protein